LFVAYSIIARRAGDEPAIGTEYDSHQIEICPIAYEKRREENDEKEEIHADKNIG
jgi:hypothetical protein